MKTRLEEHYLTAVRPALIEKFGYGNMFEVPRLEKVVINMGVGNAVRDSKKIEYKGFIITLPNALTASIKSNL